MSAEPARNPPSPLTPDEELPLRAPAPAGRGRPPPLAHRTPLGTRPATPAPDLPEGAPVTRTSRYTTSRGPPYGSECPGGGCPAQSCTPRPRRSLAAGADSGFRARPSARAEPG